MRIVDRETFLALPDGTLYAKYGDPVDSSVVDFGPLQIKVSSCCEPPVDWAYTETVPWPEEANDTGEWIEMIDRMLEGENCRLDFDVSQLRQRTVVWRFQR